MRYNKGGAIPNLLAHTPRHEEPAGEAEIVDLLGHIPPDCDYQTWLTVLMALHDRFGGSEVGLAIADNWSAQSCKYQPGEVTAKWRSFKRSGASFASLPAIARDHGACTRLILPLGVPLNQNAPGNLAKRPRFAAGLYAGCMVHVAESG